MGFIAFRNGEHNAFSAEVDPAAPVLRFREVAVWHEARGLIDKAHAEVQRIHEEARERGYVEGLEQARAELAGQKAESVERAARLLVDIEHDLSDLVFSVVRKIVGEIDPTARMMSQVVQALSAMRQQRRLILHVAPTQVQVVRKNIYGLLDAFPVAAMMEIVADDTLEGDECILDSEVGSVTVGIEAQLLALQEAFGRLAGSDTSSDYQAHTLGAELNHQLDFLPVPPTDN